ncbi:MAG TPA: hypothetical protein VK137_09555 [Planctomycetaceae bacterium]|nr:hypothetical protein [Planctomycetaceae bacterium]
MTDPQVLERLERLEREVAELKNRQLERKPGWITKIAGAFANDPDFDEVVRLGREWRMRQRDPGEPSPDEHAVEE